LLPSPISPDSRTAVAVSAVCAEGEAPQPARPAVMLATKAMTKSRIMDFERSVFFIFFSPEILCYFRLTGVLIISQKIPVLKQSFSFMFYLH
jgi:hypothetical protein